MADVLDHLLGEEGPEQRATLGGARWAELPPLKGEGDEVLGPALAAAHPRVAVLEDAAVEEGVDRVLDATAPEAVAAREVLLPAPLDLVVAGVDEVEQGRLSRPARPVECGALVGQREDLLPCMDEKRARTLSSQPIAPSSTPAHTAA